MSITYGVDEAGRGPILGPMAIAVVGVTVEQAATLTAAGVQDSKAYGSGARASKRRAELAATIMSTVRSRWSVHMVDPAEIDARVALKELNKLEQERAASLLETTARGEFSPDDLIVCDGHNLFRPLAEQFAQRCRFEAVDKGESHHVAVAAASLLAKVARDEAWEAIAAKYASEFGPIGGGGYLNAPVRRFLSAYKAKHGSLPPEARRSWKVSKGL